MSTTQKPKQATSRWAFLSQAVASVESGLDRILAEEEDASKKAPPKQANAQGDGSSARASSDIKRSDSNSRNNDRLQARLAQAMAKKGGNRASTPAPASESASRPGTPAVTEVEDDEKQKVESDVGLQADDEVTSNPAESIKPVPTPEMPPTDNSAPPKVSQDIEEIEAVRDSGENGEKELVEQSRLSIESGGLSKEATSRQSISDLPLGSDSALLSVQIEHEKSLSSLRGEINSYLERIDALQRNMQILTKETISNAKQVKADPESTQVEKQLAEKDEKIALLIDEGTKLTKGELQYRSTIKKLRAQAATLAQDQEAMRRRAERAEDSISNMEAKVTNAEVEARRRNEEISSLSKSVSDLEAIKKERSALTATLADVRAQLSRVTRRAEDAENKAHLEKLQIEQRKNAELQDDLSSAKVEREIAEDKLRREIDNLRQSLAREKEQARQMETEMLAEQATLESKLESFRVRAEEATTVGQGDSQAKLLRQIETLQTQYSAASQNWQGIESTLMGRITSLEKERDEVVNREADLRRKLRDALSKARTASKELEETQQLLHELQDQEADRKLDSQRNMRRIELLENENAKLKREFEEHRSRAEKEMARRLEEEKARWTASVSGRIDSPGASMRRGAGGSFMDSLMSPLERPNSRKSSAIHLHDIGISRVHSAASIRANGTRPETPSISLPDDQDDFFANVPPTPASAAHADSTSRLGVNDMISASTVGAGPSVQLVERMSANVRRLESEKAASKDEIARLSSQRDEARQEVVNLMRELEAKRTADSRLDSLSKEHSALSAKYQATLELLGEKSEQVEELKADIADVKQIYRQLADTMGK